MAEKRKMGRMLFYLSYRYLPLVKRECKPRLLFKALGAITNCLVINLKCVFLKLVMFSMLILKL